MCSSPSRLASLLPSLPPPPPSLQKRGNLAIIKSFTAQILEVACWGILFLFLVSSPLFLLLLLFTGAAGRRSEFGALWGTYGLERRN